jgi:beta-lactamase class A
MGVLWRRVGDDDATEFCGVRQARGSAKRGLVVAVLVALALGAASCENRAPSTSSTLSPSRMKTGFTDYTLTFTTPTDVGLQAAVEGIDARLRARYGITAEQTAVGVLDLNTRRLALVRPDRVDYAASVPKIGILLAYFQLHPEAATHLDAQTRHELRQMIKVSSNEMAAKYSQELGLKKIQAVLDSYALYDAPHGGGLWVGKHYGKGTERYTDPVGGHSHAATVRQLMRYYLLLEQDKLVSPAASGTMREIFASPGIAHVQDKFVKGLAGRPVEIRRKAGWWELWAHDTAVVTGPGRHYIVVAMTHHPKGDDYLSDFAAAVDDAVTGTKAVQK